MYHTEPEFFLKDESERDLEGKDVPEKMLEHPSLEAGLGRDYRPARRYRVNDDVRIIERSGPRLTHKVDPVT